MSTSKRSKRPAIAPEGQGVTFVELFFDLVFVFAITQVTGLVAHHLTIGGVLQGALVFWMIWWGWTQFTWALNPADTNHGWVRLGVLIATAVAFVMALSVDDAFEDGGLMFVIPYIVVRLIGLTLYGWVVSENQEQAAAVRTFTLLSLLGLAAALVGGWVAPELRVYFWIGTIVLDFVAAGVGARYGTWHLHIPHFAERHGLIVIIALGESLIAAGNGAASQESSPALFQVAVGAVVLTCILWWTYFGWLKDALEEHLEAVDGDAQAPFARDVYSLWHFPMVAGVIALAVSIEEMVAHPTEHMHLESVIAFISGIVLFVGAGMAAYWRSCRKVLVFRLACLGVMTAAVLLLRDASIVWILTAGIVAMLAIVLVEARFHREPVTA